EEQKAPTGWESVLARLLGYPLSMRHFVSGEAGRLAFEGVVQGPGQWGLALGELTARGPAPLLVLQRLGGGEATYALNYDSGWAGLKPELAPGIKSIRLSAAGVLEPARAAEADWSLRVSGGEGTHLSAATDPAAGRGSSWSEGRRRAGVRGLLRPRATHRGGPQRALRRGREAARRRREPRAGLGAAGPGPAGGDQAREREVERIPEPRCADRQERGGRLLRGPGQNRTPRGARLAVLLLRGRAEPRLGGPHVRGEPEGRGPRGRGGQPPPEGEEGRRGGLALDRGPPPPPLPEPAGSRGPVAERCRAGPGRARGGSALGDQGWRGPLGAGREAAERGVGARRGGEVHAARGGEARRLRAARPRRQAGGPPEGERGWATVRGRGRRQAPCHRQRGGRGNQLHCQQAAGQG
ncbi:unnamed protein product, partial [Prorocentrum cordatum]